MKKKLKLVSLLLAVAMAIPMTLSGCSFSNTSNTSNTSTSSNSDSKALHVGITNDITSLDYAFNYTNSNFHVVNDINDFLLVFDANGKMQPSLCTSWKCVDSLTYVYQIRKDAKFSDGTSMTVEDVVFSMNRVKDPKTAANMNYAFKNVKSITATGKWEVTVKLSQPDATWQYIPATPGCQITSEKYYNAHKNSFGNADGLTLGTGAYKVESWTKGSQVVLTRNPYYWGSKPQFDKVVMQIISDESSMEMAMESGQLDFAYIDSPDMASTYAKSKNCKVYKANSIANTLLTFNSSSGPCKDINLRKAIASAVDVKSLTKSMLGDYAQPGTAVPFGEGLYVLDPATWKARVAKMTNYDYNMQKAKEYKDKSSYSGQALTLYIIEGNNVYANIAQAIQASCAAMGIKINIQKETSSQYYADAYGNNLNSSGNRKYDMMINRWTPDFVDPAGDLDIFLNSSNAGAGGANYAGYKNSKVDKLLTQQSKSTNAKERSELLLQVSEIAAEDSPYKALYYIDTIYAESNRISYQMPGFWIYSLFWKDVKLSK